MKCMRFNFKWLLWFVSGLLLVLTARSIELESLLTPMLGWIDSLGVWRAIAFIGVYIIATLICLPGSILALGGGALFGAIWGAVFVFLGGFLGAVSAFSLGRSLLKERVAKRLEKNPYLQALNSAVVTKGWKIACLLHLSPMIPFNVLNYALGASKISFKDFAIATGIGIVPGVILYSFLGSAIGDFTMIMMGMSESHSRVRLFFTIAGSIVTLLLTIYLARIARQTIDNKIH